MVWSISSGRARPLVGPATLLVALGLLHASEGGGSAPEPPAPVTAPGEGAPPAGEPPANPAPSTEERQASGGWFGTDRPLIVPPFVDAFPGVDLKALTPPEQERFLHRANTEACTCGQAGCERHTLAFCLKVDPGCPRARAALRKIAADILAARPKAAPPARGATSPPR